MTARPRIIVAGAGPAGLMAAEAAALAGAEVIVHERKPAPARKLLLAGRGGLNLTHSEPLERFLTRYDTKAVRPAIASFDPGALRVWAGGLGERTFVGSSGRVFPQSFKASPLLRAWLRRLEELGVRMVTRSAWTGFDAHGKPVFRVDGGAPRAEACGATVLALGGASWPELGADGNWVGPLQAYGVDISALQASNCGVVADWSDAVARHAGQPVKAVRLSLGNHSALGDLMLTSSGLEGGPVYALSGAVRAELDRSGSARLMLDLRPQQTQEALAAKLSRGRTGQSLATRLKGALSLTQAAMALLREGHGRALPSDPSALASCIKRTPVVVRATAGLERAISTAGGVRFSGLTDRAMLRARPGVFVAGEMLDWDAPTGGYLLQACFATGRAAGLAAVDWAMQRRD